MEASEATPGCSVKQLLEREGPAVVETRGLDVKSSLGNKTSWKIEDWQLCDQRILSVLSSGIVSG